MLREDRRIVPRQGCTDMDAHLKVVSWYMMLLRPMQVNAIDFHSKGMSFVSKKIFKPGQEILLYLNSPFHSVKELPGKICYCNKLGNGFHCGVEFMVAKSQGQKGDMLSLLKIIEEHLKQTNHVKKLSLFFGYDHQDTSTA